MSETEILLNSLRDIHEPVAPAGVSPWLLAANLSVLALLLWAILARRKRQRESWRVEALQQVKAARTMTFDEGVLHLASLLRRLLIHRQETVNRLDGDAWLLKLDAHFSTNWFSESDGCVFGNSLYQPSSDSRTDLDTLCDSLSRLIIALPPTPLTDVHSHDPV